MKMLGKHSLSEHTTATFSSSGVLFKGSCGLIDVLLCSAGAASTVTFYDGVDDTGEVKLKVASLANHSSINNFSLAIHFYIGMYAVITGTGAIVTANYGLTGHRE